MTVCTRTVHLPPSTFHLPPSNFHFTRPANCPLPVHLLLLSWFLASSHLPVLDLLLDTEGERGALSTNGPCERAADNEDADDDGYVNRRVQEDLALAREAVAGSWQGGSSTDEARRVEAAAMAAAQAAAVAAAEEAKARERQLHEEMQARVKAEARAAAAAEASSGSRTHLRTASIHALCRAPCYEYPCDPLLYPWPSDPSFVSNG